MKDFSLSTYMERLKAIDVVGEQLKAWKLLHPTKPEFVFWDDLKVQRERERRNTHKVRGTLTNAPCTASCWLAEGYNCACSCGGKNHGIGHAPEQK